ncbi:MAG: hypothetical protein IT435_16830 [Phycisphaerales bacterium]|nr:hypothetical protein [Phycisphaerales bacterium]
MTAHDRTSGRVWKLAIVLACGALAGGCASESNRYDSLAAQTSRPGWVVGDSLGMTLAPQSPQRMSITRGNGPTSSSSVASGQADSDE